jgi:hypothetical protein
MFREYWPTVLEMGNLYKCKIIVEIDECRLFEEIERIRVRMTIITYCDFRPNRCLTSITIAYRYSGRVANQKANPGKSRPWTAETVNDFTTNVAKPKKSLSAVDRRAEELDTIAAVLPLERRDELAELLTDQDVETLRHLVNEGMGDNTLAGADLRSRLSAGLVAGCHRCLPALAGARSAAAEIRCPSSLGSAARRPIPITVCRRPSSKACAARVFCKSTGPHAPDTVYAGGLRHGRR